MKLLTVTTLYPFANNPKNGIFIETRLRQLLLQYPEIEAKVIAPVPYFPFTHPRFGHYAEFAKAPRFEQRFGIDVYHPRYLVVPKIGMTLTPLTLAQSIYHQARDIQNQGYDFDVIDGHYFYPDGVAIARVAKKLHKPFTVTARGTDINLIPHYHGPKRQIQSVLAQSSHNMAVCEALRQTMIQLGANPNRVSTLRNGVDLDVFAFTSEQQQRERRTQLHLPTATPVILSVGHLIERKGHHLVIQAISQLPNVTLLIAGDGPERKKLEQLVIATHTEHRVMFLGSLDQHTLAQYYGAANLLVLASSREGWANVLLESMACGTPVVATNIWGTPEVVTKPEAGQLVERNADDIKTGITAVLDQSIDRQLTRTYAEQFTWRSTSEKQYQIFHTLCDATHQPVALAEKLL